LGGRAVGVGVVERRPEDYIGSSFESWKEEGEKSHPQDQPLEMRAQPQIVIFEEDLRPWVYLEIERCFLGISRNKPEQKVCFARNCVHKENSNTSAKYFPMSITSGSRSVIGPRCKDHG
tara:strand:+ start:512 stop:868 length:357 start_codon:yes stop_codon:yes gene_type:complete